MRHAVDYCSCLIVAAVIVVATFGVPVPSEPASEMPFDVIFDTRSERPLVTLPTTV